MVVDNLNVVRRTIIPFKTYAILVVYSDAILAFFITAQ